jgi:hypothetical protein
MDYEELADLPEEYLIQPTDDEITKTNKQKLAELHREEKAIKIRKITILSALSDPEVNKRLVGLTSTAVRTIMQNELTEANLSEQPFVLFSEQDQEFYMERKSKQVYNLHTKVMQDQEIGTAVEPLKEKGRLDMRTQRHKKQPHKYIASIAQAKLLMDLAKKSKEQEERLARLEIAQKSNEDRFQQIGDALLVHEEKLKALKVLGVKSLQLEAYKLKLNQPELTQEQIGLKIGKDRRTIIRWFNEIDTLIEKEQIRP